MKIIGYIFTTVLVSIYGSILNGWALSKLWGWFVVTSLHAPTLTIAPAIGIAMVVSYLTQPIKLSEYKETREKKTAGTILLEAFLFVTFKPLLALFFGSIVKSFMN